MKTSDAEALTLAYIEQYCPKYKFGWMTSARTLGQCVTSYFINIIKLNIDYVRLNDESKVELTIIHEIAHALTPGHNHDYVWQRKCRELGGNGLRLSNGANLPPNKYIGICPGGHSHSFARIPTRRKSCTECFPHAFNENYEIKVIPNPNYRK
jgi:hypothetical protein